MHDIFKEKVLGKLEIKNDDDEKWWDELKNKAPNAVLDNEHNFVICEDQYVATIEISRAKIAFEIDEIQCRVSANIKKIESENIPTIALVLESPHKKEYDEKSTPLGPARGTTGNNIQSCLLGNLAKFSVINDQNHNGSYFLSSSRIAEGKYRLLLINAVQFQCSLGDLCGKKKARRDEIFNAVWENGGKNDFTDRLKKYNPHIIINCCTGEEHENSSLKISVQEAIDENFPSALKLQGAHPASAWFSKGFVKV